MNILFLIIFLFFIGVFAGFEAGFYVLNPVKLDILTAKKNNNAILLKWFKKHKEHLITSVLIATNLFNYLFSGLLLLTLSSIDIRYRLFLSTFIGTFFVFVFGEIYPKFLFQSYSGTLNYIFVKVIYIFHILLFPVSFIIMSLTAFMTRILRIKRKKISHIYSRKSIAAFIEQAHKFNIIDKPKRKMLYSILKLKQSIVSDIMVKKENVVCFHLDDNISKVIEALKTRQYKRYPIFDGQNGIMILNSMSLFWQEGEIKKIRDIFEHLIKPVYIDESSSQLSAMQTMQSNNCVLAIITKENEFSGILTLRDIIDSSITPFPDL